MLISRRLPGHIPDTVKAHQAKFRTQPEIAVWGLCHGGDFALCETVADFPRGVRVLADVQCWIQCENARAHCQKDKRQRSPQQNRMPHLSPHKNAVPHILSHLYFPGVIRTAAFTRVSRDLARDRQNIYKPTP